MAEIASRHRSAGAEESEDSLNSAGREAKQSDISCYSASLCVRCLLCYNSCWNSAQCDVVGISSNLCSCSSLVDIFPPDQFATEHSLLNAADFDCLGCGTMFGAAAVDDGPVLCPATGDSIFLTFVWSVRSWVRCR